MKRFTQARKTQMLTGGLVHFTVTGVDMRPTADKSNVQDFYEQSRVLESIIEIFRVRANVVLVSETKEEGVTIAVEHNDAVDASEIQGKIQELGEVPFGDGDTLDLSSVEVTEVTYDILPTPAPVIDTNNSSIQEVGGDVVITVQAGGDDLDYLEVDHNAEGTLPEFSIYADSNDVWGDPQSQADADAAGIEATYSNGTWTITLLEGGTALNTWINDFGGYIRMLFVVHNTDGNASGSMSGGNYFELELTVTP